MDINTIEQNNSENCPKIERTHQKNMQEPKSYGNQRIDRGKPFNVIISPE